MCSLVLKRADLYVKILRQCQYTETSIQFLPLLIFCWSNLFQSLRSSLPEPIAFHPDPQDLTRLVTQLESLKFHTSMALSSERRETAGVVLTGPGIPYNTFMVWLSQSWCLQELKC